LVVQGDAWQCSIPGMMTETTQVGVALGQSASVVQIRGLLVLLLQAMAHWVPSTGPDSCSQHT
jgi:hypothetical protein